MLIAIEMIESEIIICGQTKQTKQSSSEIKHIDHFQMIFMHFHFWFYVLFNH